MALDHWEELLHICAEFPCAPLWRVSFFAKIKQSAANCMPRKKKIKPFRAVTAVKELARERVGTPPAGKIVVEKKKKPEKHKPTLERLLRDSE
jgi:hypothetical protein